MWCMLGFVFLGQGCRIFLSLLEVLDVYVMVWIDQVSRGAMSSMTEVKECLVWFMNHCLYALLI